MEAKLTKKPMTIEDVVNLVPEPQAKKEVPIKRNRLNS